MRKYRIIGDLFGTAGEFINHAFGVQGRVDGDVFIYADKVFNGISGPVHLHSGFTSTVLP